MSELKIGDFYTLSDHPVQLNIEELNKNKNKYTSSFIVPSIFLLLVFYKLQLQWLYCVIVMTILLSYKYLIFMVISFVYLLNPPIIVSHADEKRMLEIYRIRYKTFCEKLKWVHGDPDKRMEFDVWDEKENTVHIGLVFFGHVRAYVRVIYGKSIKDYMLGNEFQPMLPHGSRFFDEDAYNNLEVTRFCVDHRVPKWLRPFLIVLLFKRVYCWGLENKRLRGWCLTSLQVANHINKLCKSMGMKHFIVSANKMSGDNRQYMVSFACIKA
jgi:hypothetical protein